MIVSFCEFLDYSWGCNLMRRFSVSVRNITLSKLFFVVDINSDGGGGYPQISLKMGHNEF